MSASRKESMERVWLAVKDSLQKTMNPEAFQRWIRPLRFIDCRDSTIIIGCPSSFFKEWVESHHGRSLQEALDANLGEGFRLHYRVAKDEEASPRRKAPTGQMNFAHLSSSPLWRSGLNGHYTFERFVVGPCNEFAYTASLEVARTPQTRYNPLLLLADVGLGKSHLSSAIGNHILAHEQGKRVYYTTAEEFVNEMVHFLRNRRFETFKEKFRHQCDVLVLDGVQFLSGKSRTQDELAHTFDALFYSKKRIVLTSNLHPRDIPEMDEALSSRLSSGLTVDIKPPDFSTRCRILTHKARMEGLDLPPEVAEYIAERVTGNVRHLESVLIHLIAKSSLLHRPLDLHLAEEVVAAFHPELTQPRKPTIEEIQECVCRHFQLSREALVSRSRKKSVYYPRQLAMYLCRQHTEATLKVIGRAFNRDHASVIHSLAVIQRKFKQDTTTRNHITFLESRILSGSPAPKCGRDNGRPLRKETAS